MTAAPDARKRLLGAVHAEATRAGLDDDTYRDLMERVTGQRSAKELTHAQLGRVLDAIKGGKRGAPGRARAEAPQARLARALWLSLFLLGEVEADGEAALAAFAKRQTRVDGLQWLGPAQWRSVIEALKAMCARAGFAVPMEAGPDRNQVVDGHGARVALARALWTRLHTAGAVRIASHSALDQWAKGITRLGARDLNQLDDAQLDAINRALGQWLRQHKARAALADVVQDLRERADP